MEDFKECFHKVAKNYSDSKFKKLSRNKIFALVFEIYICKGDFLKFLDKD